MNRNDDVTEITEKSAEPVQPEQKVQKRESTKKAIEIVADWRREHPTGHKAELEKTGLTSLSSINRYWDNCGEGDRPLSALERIIIWRDENPMGTKKECQKVLGLSRRIVYLRWNEKLQPRKPRKKRKIAQTTVTSDSASAVSPSSETSASNADTEPEDEIKISVDKNGQQFFDF